MSSDFQKLLVSEFTLQNILNNVVIKNLNSGQYVALTRELPSVLMPENSEKNQVHCRPYAVREIHIFKHSGSCFRRRFMYLGKV